MPSSARLLLIPILVSIALCAAACSGSGDSTSRPRGSQEAGVPTSTSPPSDATTSAPGGDADPGGSEQPPEGFTKYETNRGGSSTWELVGVRSARNDDFDRVVVDVADATPIWDASLEAIGDEAEVVLTLPVPTKPIQPDPDRGIFEDGDPDQYSCTGEPNARLEVIDRCSWHTSASESEFTVHLDRSAPYRVQVLDGRLVIDVLGSGEVSGSGSPQDAVTGFVFAWDEGNRTAMGTFATSAVMDDFQQDPLLGDIAMDVPNCTGAEPEARCEDVWVFYNGEDIASTVGYFDFDLRFDGQAWRITRISCDPIYDC